MTSRETIDPNVDKAIALGRDQGLPELDVSLIDRVFRPACHVLLDAQEAGATTEEVRDAIALLAANLISETILRMIERGDVEGAMMLAQDMVNDMANHLGQALVQNMTVRN